MRASKNESGFALILAILALMLLTFLGLTLVTTTSTELQIATNYRWSQQALYNAEAGVEAAKQLLRTSNWVASVPSARVYAWNGSTAPTAAGGSPPAAVVNARVDQWGNSSRNFENWECDTRGNGIGYGAVLDDGGAAGPHQYRTNFFGNDLNGSVTLWVRRPTWHLMDGTLTDYGTAVDADGNSVVVLTAEGIAPYTGSAATMASTVSNRAVQVVEVVLRLRTNLTVDPCEGGRYGQAGGSQEGANFGSCAPLSATAVADGVGTPLGGTGDGTLVR